MHDAPWGKIYVCIENANKVAVLRTAAQMVRMYHIMHMVVNGLRTSAVRPYCELLLCTALIPYHRVLVYIQMTRRAQHLRAAHQRRGWMYFLFFKRKNTRCATSFLQQRTQRKPGKCSPGREVSEVELSESAAESINQVYQGHMTWCDKCKKICITTQ